MPHRVLAAAAREVRDVLRAATPTHRHLRDHLTVVVIVTVGVDLAFTVLAFLCERHAAQTEVKTVGSALFWTTTASARVPQRGSSVARQSRAADALSPREDDRRRRPGRVVGGIDRTTSPVTASTLRNMTPRARSAGTTSRRSSRRPWSATSPTTSSCAGARSPARRSPRPFHRRRRRGYGAGRAHRARGDLRRGRGRRPSRARVLLRTLRDAQRFIYLENQFRGHRKSSMRCASSAIHQTTTFGSSCCCRPNPTTARTTPAVSSRCSPRPTTTPHAPLQSPCAPRTAIGPTRSLFTPRSRSSTATG